MHLQLYDFDPKRVLSAYNVCLHAPPPPPSQAYFTMHPPSHLSNQSSAMHNFKKIEFPILLVSILILILYTVQCCNRTSILHGLPKSYELQSIVLCLIYFCFCLASPKSHTHTYSIPGLTKLINKLNDFHPTLPICLTILATYIEKYSNFLP